MNSSNSSYTRKRYSIRLNHIKQMTEQLMNEIESEAIDVCPLASLYLNKRKCDICTKLKAESKFLYPSVCSHIFCVDCIKMALRIDRYPYRCMMCRTICSTFTHVVKEGEQYRIKIYNIEDLQINRHDNEDIASLIQDEDLRA